MDGERGGEGEEEAEVLRFIYLTNKKKKEHLARGTCSGAHALHVDQAGV